MQKVIKVTENEMTKLDEYLSDGWEVKTMTACSVNSRFTSGINYSVCYILIEKK